MKALVITGLVGVGMLALAVGTGSPASRVARPTGRVGRHWTWEELTVSAKARALGLDNTPPPWVQRNLEWMVREVLDPLRERYGRDAVRVNSGFRSPAVNQAVGGVPGSLHQAGLAFDLAGAFLGDPGAIVVLRTVGLRVLHYERHVHVEQRLRLPSGSYPANTSRSNQGFQARVRYA